MEGPSLHILAKKLQNFKNKKVINAFGNAKFDKDILINQKIKDIYAFGKRLIIQLEDCAIVTHFLMWGSYTIDQQKEHLSPRLVLITKDHSLYLYNTSTKLILDTNLKEKLPLEFDVLSKNWDLSKVIQAISQHPEETIDDILLDQDIFAGVGNIIKNEALFLSKVLPYKKIKELNLNKLKEIALITREFSKRFLKLRQEFKLKKNLQIYRKKLCSICNLKVNRIKTGKKNRWSFFCSSCQT